MQKPEISGFGHTHTDLGNIPTMAEARFGSQPRKISPSRATCHANQGWPAALVNMLMAALIPATLAASITLTN